MVITSGILTDQISNTIGFFELQTHIIVDVGCNGATACVTIIPFIQALYAFSAKSGPITWGQLKENFTFECSKENVAHLSMRGAQNTMDTREIPKWHPGLVAPLVKGPKWS